MGFSVTFIFESLSKLLTLTAKTPTKNDSFVEIQNCNYLTRITLTAHSDSVRYFVSFVAITNDYSFGYYKSLLALRKGNTRGTSRVLIFFF